MLQNLAFDKFTESIQHLATSPAPLPERLRSAFDRFYPVEVADMPTDELRELLMALLRALSKVNDPYRGHVNATIAAMREEEAAEAAAMIWKIYFGLREWHYDAAGYRS